MVGFLISSTHTNCTPTSTRQEENHSLTLEYELEHLHRWRLSSILFGVSVRLNAGCLFHCFLVDHLVLRLHIPQQQQSFLMFLLVNTCAVHGAVCAENKGLYKERWSYLTFFVSEMCILKGTSLMVVLSLISLIISSTLSVGCFVGFKGGSSLICVQKSYFKSRHGHNDILFFTVLATFIIIWQ